MIIFTRFTKSIRMDFIVSYYLYSQIRKKESEKSIEKKPIPLRDYQDENNKINHTCPRCGQDPYFCQCKNNVKAMYKYFNPEKDIY